MVIRIGKDIRQQHIDHCEMGDLFPLLALAIAFICVSSKYEQHEVFFIFK